MSEATGTSEAKVASAAEGPTRRDLLAASVATAGSSVVLAMAPAIVRAQSLGDGPIKFGLIEDYSGNAAYQGLPKLHATELAIKEINEGLTLKGGALGPGGLGAMGSHAAAPPTMNIKERVVGDGGGLGEKTMVFVEEDEILEPSGDDGLLGREVELIAPDAQSDNRRYQALARRLVQDDQVDVVMGAGFSSSREAIRPILHQAKKLYVYNSQYEGGVADKYTFCTGALPEQQVIPVLRYLIDNFGLLRFYIIGADYNFGQLTAMWARAVAPSMGGEVIGQEFIPLSDSQFSSTISNIQVQDWLFVLLSGENHTNYYPQANAAGLAGLPMGATTNMMQGYEHIRFAPPAISNMHNAVEYMEEIPTPRNEAFVQRFRALYPDEPYINELCASSPTWQSTSGPGRCVRRRPPRPKRSSRSWNPDLGVEAPEGWVFMDPATHHVSQTIRLARSDDNYNISFVKEWPGVEPWWTRRLGVNLVSRPNPSSTPRRTIRF